MRKKDAAVPVPTTIEAYLKAVSEPARTTLSKLCAAIRSVVPPETSEGISYGMPAFKYKGPLVYFSAFKNHCSFFPGNSKLVAQFSDELKDCSCSKGTIRFPVDRPLPAALVNKIVKIRIAENDARKR